jgi:ABC-type sugar transport system substrate-binding protein
MFISLVRNAIEAEAKEQGLPPFPRTLRRTRTAAQPDRQFVAQGAQVLVINPVDATSAPAIIDAAKGRKAHPFQQAPRGQVHRRQKHTSTWVPTNPSWGPIQAEMIDAYFKAKGVDKKGGLKYVTLHG